MEETEFLNKTEKIKLFVSYSRRDKVLVDTLHEALSEDNELEVYLDTHDLEPGVEWKSRLEDFIRAADTVLFALSPDSVSSEMCQWEMELAVQLNKRIIPVVVQDVTESETPDAVSKLNYIFFPQKTELEPALKSIGEALKIDIDWIKEHTRLGDLAERWDKAAKLGAQPLRGKELEGAEQWVANQPKDAPQPTQLQRRYIFESRKSASKRQRSLVMVSIAAVLIFGALGAFSWVQRNAAIEGERKAESALRSATEASNILVSKLAQEFKDKSVPSSIVKSILSIAKKLQDDLNNEFSNDALLMQSRGIALLELGDVFVKTDSFTDAKNAFEQAGGIFKALVRRNPSNQKYKYDSALAKLRISSLQIGNQFEILEARKLADSARNNLEQLFKTSRNPIHEAALINSYRYIAETYTLSDNAEKALNVLTSLSLTQKESELCFKNTYCRSSKLSLNEMIADISIKQKNYESAINVYIYSWEFFKEQVQRDRSNTGFVVELNAIESKLSFFFSKSGQTKRSINLIFDVLKRKRILLKNDSTNTVFMTSLANTLFNIGNNFSDLGERSDAIRYYKEALSLELTASSIKPKNVQLKLDIAKSECNLGYAFRFLKTKAKSLQHFKNCVTIHANIQKKYGRNSQRDIWYGNALRMLGNGQKAFADNSEAAKSFKKEIQLLLPIKNKSLRVIENLIFSYYSLSTVEQTVKNLEKALAVAKSVSKTKTNVRIKKLIGEVSVELAISFGNKSFTELMSKKFSDAEKTSLKAIQLDPKPLWMKTNLAHALMLQGKTEKAQEIYLKYRGQELSKGKLWEEVILADFKDFKSKGITHTHMAEIERLFKN